MPELYPDLPTPTVLVDLDRMEGNIRRLQDLCDRHKVKLRPHMKTHKMVEVARRQLTAGAAAVGAAMSVVRAALPRLRRSVRARPPY